MTKKIQDFALWAFKALGASGVARIDFLVNIKKEIVYINEINTIPGFTSISMYPKLWEASGLSYAKLIDRVIELAIERHNKESRLKN